MKVVYSAGHLSHRARRVLTIGTFDGVHVGHQKILKTLVRTARRLKAKSVILTFRDHPQKVLRPQRPMPLLISLNGKLRLFKKLGVDYCLIVNFNKAFFSQTPHRFVQTFLVDSLRIDHLVLGYNFCFGRDRKGDVKLLARLAKPLGFGLTVVSPVRQEGKNVSSTRIRRLIEKSRFKKASRLLGRPYALEGRVIHGDGRGRGLGYRTANVKLDLAQTPPIGVYAAHVLVGGVRKSGMVNVGWRPTFIAPSRRPAYPTVEVHLFDFKRDILGSCLRLEFLERIRGERRFPSSQALRSRLQKDEGIARQICAN